MTPLQKAIIARRARVGSRPLAAQKLPTGPQATLAVALRKLSKELAARARGLVEAELRTRTDAPPPDGDAPSLDRAAIKRVVATLKAMVKNLTTSPSLVRVLEAVGARTADVSRAELRKQIKAAAGIDFEVKQPWLARLMKSFRIESVTLIRDVMMERVQRVGQILDEDKGRRVDGLAVTIERETAFMPDRSMLIARDQVLKFSAEVTKRQHEEVGITEYTWSTSGDARVRPEHRVLDGRVFAYDDPPVVSQDGTRGNPGTHFQCRCVAIPIIKRVERDVSADVSPLSSDR